MPSVEITAKHHPLLYANMQVVRRAMHARYPELDGVVAKIRVFVRDETETMEGDAKAQRITISPAYARELDAGKVQGILAHEYGHVLLDGGYLKSEAIGITKSRECRADFFSEQVLPGQLAQGMGNENMAHRFLLSIAQWLGDAHPTHAQRMDMLGAMTPTVREHDVRHLNFSADCKITRR